MRVPVQSACYVMVNNPSVRVEPAGAHELPLVGNLMELYLHDMSEVFPIDVGEDGRFGYDGLPSYWAEPDRRMPFLIRSGGHVAGFALVTVGSPAFEGMTALDLAEFFVL